MDIYRKGVRAPAAFPLSRQVEDMPWEERDAEALASFANF